MTRDQRSIFATEPVSRYWKLSMRKLPLIVLDSHALRIHVLFTDIQMPGTIDGLALAHHTSKHWPWIGLLITSARPRPDRAAFPEESRFLAKPYQHRHVIHHIRELAAAA
jgi:DNA-binding LytR/AlgR family response regulator